MMQCSSLLRCLANTASRCCSAKMNPIEPRSLSAANRIARAVWMVVRALVFVTSPSPLFRWRRLVLIAFGARLHPTAKIYPSTKIWAPWNLQMDQNSCLAHSVDCYNVAFVRIGSDSTVSQYTYLCTASHDIRNANHALIAGEITINSGTWVAACSFIGPGVRLGAGSVIGARSVVMADIPDNVVAYGHPAKVVRSRSKGTERR